MNIKCVFRSEKKFDVLTYNCIVSSKKLKNRCKLKSFKGVHESGKCNANVKSLWFRDATIHYLPRGLHEIFPNLTSLLLLDCGLKEISSSDLIGLENLEALRLRGNELTTLPDDLFANMKRLRIIDFSYNQLEFVSSRLLSPIPENQLIYVNLAENKEINSFYNQKCLKGISISELKNIIDLKCKPPTLNRVQSAPETDSSWSKKLWESDRFSDLTILVEDQEIHVHQCVLAAQSSIFDSILQVNQQAFGTRTLEINGYSVSIVRQFLRHLYTGQSEDDGNAIELYSLAAQFNISELKSLCETRVLRDLGESSEENCLRVFEMGTHYVSKDIAEAAFEKIKKMNPDVKLDNGLLKRPEYLLKIIEAKHELAAKMQEEEKKLKKLIESLTFESSK